MQRVAPGDDWLISILPHYARRGRQLFFFGDATPSYELGDEDVPLFDAMVASVPFSHLRDQRSRAAELVAILCERGIAIAHPPVPRAAGPHLFVIEPHMDDAVLAVGGQLLLRSRVQPITVLTVVRESEYTKYAGVGGVALDRRAVSELRLAESRLASGLVGFRHEVMDELDFPLRVRAEHGQGTPALDQAFKRFGPAAADVVPLAKQIFARVSEAAPEEVWIPLGVGENPDHVRTSAACLLMLNVEHEFFAGKRISFYDDLAPIPAFRGHSDRIVAVHRRSGTLRRVEEDVTSVFADKLRAVALFASQWDMAATKKHNSDMAAMVTASASPSEGSERRVELRYEIERAPRVPAFGEVAFRPAELAATKVALAPWLRSRTHVRRIVIASATSFGRWRVGLDVLTRVFPNATFEVLATEEHFWELSTARSAAVSSKQVSRDELRAFVEQLDTKGAAVLVIGDGAKAPGSVYAPTFGDAITALSELVFDDPFVP